MNKIKVYLDTSVISYLDQVDALERMKETQDVWELFKRGQYEIYISDIVVYEIGKCSVEKRKILLSYLDQIEYTIIETDEDTVILAEKFIDFGFLKRKSYDDCRHIAAAIMAGCDFIISWNFKHIVNVRTIRGIKAVTTYEGYKDLMIYPPSALLEEEDENCGNDKE
ncbi:MAG: PIN domain-containing protein [Roseburia sp.]|nr:PIN domain-containing protein [Roseburia sp.]MCM1242262.1 PIN domain-containing protein [Roseburia sp.]